MFRKNVCRAEQYFVIIIAGLCVILSGCESSLQPTASVLPTPETSACKARINRAVWIAPVEVTDLDRSKHGDIEGRLTGNIRKYIADANCFGEVRQVSGQTAGPGQTDIILKFVFDRYEVDHGNHPEFIPLAIVTFTVWIWVGGDMYYNETDFRATLTVSDSSGRQITNVSAKHNHKEHYSLYNMAERTPALTGYLLPGQARAALVKELMDKAMPALKGP
jgi:hypothetical protein